MLCRAAPRSIPPHVGLEVAGFAPGFDESGRQAAAVTAAWSSNRCPSKGHLLVACLVSVVDGAAGGDSGRRAAVALRRAPRRRSDGTGTGARRSPSIRGSTAANGGYPVSLRT